MPLYDFRCRRCGQVTSFFEAMGEKKFFWQRRCGSCRSWRLERVYSSCGVSVSRSTTDMLNEISRMGPINFVPQTPRPAGPPPGGCPYAQPPEGEKQSPSAARGVIEISGGGPHPSASSG